MAEDASTQPTARGAGKAGARHRPRRRAWRWLAGTLALLVVVAAAALALLQES
jgi:hypothetical protein